MRVLELGLIAVLGLLAVVLVGIDQGRQPDSKRPVETKGELEELHKEHLEKAVPLRK